MLVVVLVVVTVSPHPMGSSGCGEVRDDRDVAKADERWVACWNRLPRGRGKWREHRAS